MFCHDSWSIVRDFAMNSNPCIKSEICVLLSLCNDRDNSFSDQTRVDWRKLRIPHRFRCTFVDCRFCFTTPPGSEFRFNSCTRLS